MADSCPDLIEPFSGWRVLLYEHAHRQICSLNNALWTGPEHEAICVKVPGSSLSEKHPSPYPFCYCGLYSCKEMDFLCSYALDGIDGHMYMSSRQRSSDRWADSRRIYHWIFAKVDVYGTVIKATNGYRSSRQRITDLYIPHDDFREHISQLEGFTDLAIHPHQPLEYLAHTLDRAFMRSTGWKTTLENWIKQYDEHTAAARA